MEVVPLRPAYALGVVRTGLARMIDAGLVKPYPLDLIARMLLALLRETSAEVARSKHDPKARAQVSEFVAGVLNTLSTR